MNRKLENKIIINCSNLEEFISKNAKNYSRTKFKKIWNTKKLYILCLKNLNIHLNYSKKSYIQDGKNFR